MIRVWFPYTFHNRGSKKGYRTWNAGTGDATVRLIDNNNNNNNAHRSFFSKLSRLCSLLYVISVRSAAPGSSVEAMVRGRHPFERNRRSPPHRRLLCPATLPVHCSRSYPRKNLITGYWHPPLYTVRWWRENDILVYNINWFRSST